MTITPPLAPPSPLTAIFERYHVGWVTRDPDRIAAAHSEDTVFCLHDGSIPVTGRAALRRECARLFAAYDFSFEAGRKLYGEDHWTFEWTMVLSLTEPGGAPFTARVEMLDVVTLNARGEVSRKDVYLNGKQADLAFARAGIER